MFDNWNDQTGGGDHLVGTGMEPKTTFREAVCAGTQSSAQRIIDADSAMAALMAGRIVRRIEASGAPAQFLRLTNGRIEAASTGRRVVENRWEAATVDIATFWASTFRVVKDVRVSSVEVVETGALIDVRTALKEMRAGRIVHRIDAAGVGSHYFRIQEGVVQSAEDQKAVGEGRWETACTDVGAFLSSKGFRLVGGLSIRDVSVIYDDVAA